MDLYPAGNFFLPVFSAAGNIRNLSFSPMVKHSGQQA